MARKSQTQNSSGLLYFSYTGAVVAAVLVITFAGGLFNHAWDEVLTRAVFASFGVTATYAGVTLAQRLRRHPCLLNVSHVAALRETGSRDRTRRWIVGFALVTSAVLVVAASALLFVMHRRFVGVVGILEACAIYALRRPIEPRAITALLVLGISSWGLSAGLTYTNLGDWLLNSNTSSLATAAFAFSFGLVLLELCDERFAAGVRSKSRFAVAVVVATIFFAFSFRSDSLLSSWVPYHRSFVVDVAQAVREGHWLLWDIPSIYGFLSILAVASIPAKDAWQGLFTLTSIILFIQSCLIFTLWRWGRNGKLNLAFSILLTLATFGDGIARYPWSARLYPQGALRFIWVLGFLGAAFFMYVWREKPKRVEALYWGGNVLWLVSLFWAFETAVWATLIWPPYLAVATLTQGARQGLLRRMGLRFLPLLVLPPAAIGIIDVVYRSTLGHEPDWFGYFQFTGLFVSGTLHAPFPTNPAGAAWSLVLILGAAGSVGIAAIRRGAWAVTPLLVATWLAVWTTSTYFAVEPFDGHVSLLLPIVVAAAAIITFVSREALPGDRAALYARLSIAPIATVLIALFIGEPSAFAAMKFPFTPGWTSDTLQYLPPIRGELAALIARAGIQPGSRLLIPNRPLWTEVSQGMLFPVTYAPGIGNVAYRAWAPLSPLGIENPIMTLPKKLRHVYIERFLAEKHLGGWYIEYRGPAVCERISSALRTSRTITSANYSASECTFESRRHSASAPVDEL